MLGKRCPFLGWTEIVDYTSKYYARNGITKVPYSTSIFSVVPDCTCTVLGFNLFLGKAERSTSTVRALGILTWMILLIGGRNFLSYPATRRKIQDFQKYWRTLTIYGLLCVTTNCADSLHGAAKWVSIYHVFTYRPLSSHKALPAHDKGSSPTILGFSLGLAFNGPPSISWGNQ